MITEAPDSGEKRQQQKIREQLENINAAGIYLLIIVLVLFFRSPHVP